MTTARINNHKNKGDSIIVGFSPNSLKINRANNKIELLASIYYDQTNIDSIKELVDFTNRNNLKIVSFTYKTICVVGYLSRYHIDYTLFDPCGNPIRAKVEIIIHEK